MGEEITGRRRAGFRRSGTRDRLTGTVTRWQPGETFGFITGDDGGSYFLSRDDLPREHDSLQVGTHVEFTSEGTPSPGKQYLRARAVRLAGEEGT